MEQVAAPPANYLLPRQALTTHTEKLKKILRKIGRPALYNSVIGNATGIHCEAEQREKGTENYDRTADLATYDGRRQACKGLSYIGVVRGIFCQLLFFRAQNIRDSEVGATVDSQN